MDNKERESREVRTTNQQVGNTNVQREVVTESQSAPSRVLGQQIVWYITGVITALLALRLVLRLLGANQDNGFVDFVYGLSGIFASPFFGMFSYTPSYGQSTFEVSTLVAILIYALIGWGIAKLLTLGSNRQDV